MLLNPDNNTPGKRHIILPVTPNPRVTSGSDGGKRRPTLDCSGKVVMTWFYTIKYGVSNRRRTLHILSVKRVWCLSLFEHEDWDFGWDSTQAYIGNPDWHLMNARERKPAGLEIEAVGGEQEFFESDSDDAFFVAGQAGVSAHHDDFFE
ncbi:Uncharacterised protein [Mobiluncus mulieris]|nr:Uncharacterised protein [Mobiluncus mulieris]